MLTALSSMPLATRCVALTPCLCRLLRVPSLNVRCRRGRPRCAGVRARISARLRASCSPKARRTASLGRPSRCGLSRTGSPPTTWIDALGTSSGNDVTRAYQRSDFFDAKRRLARGVGSIRDIASLIVASTRSLGNRPVSARQPPRQRVCRRSPPDCPATRQRVSTQRPCERQPELHMNFVKR